MNNVHCIVLLIFCFVYFAFTYCDDIVDVSDPGMEDAGVTGSLGLLDTQEMWQGVAGEKQEAAHGGQTFTFPPDQEVAMLLDQAPIISFQQPV